MWIVGFCIHMSPSQSVEILLVFPLSGLGHKNSCTLKMYSGFQKKCQSPSGFIMLLRLPKRAFMALGVARKLMKNKPGRLLIVLLSVVSQPAMRMFVFRVSMRPVDNTAFGIPFVLAIKQNLIAHT